MMKIRFLRPPTGGLFMRTSANQRYNQLLSLLLVALPVIGGGNYEMHNDPHSWPDLLELLQSWWRGDTPLGAVIMSIVMAGLRIAYFGGVAGSEKRSRFCSVVL